MAKKAKKKAVSRKPIPTENKTKGVVPPETPKAPEEPEPISELAMTREEILELDLNESRVNMQATVLQNLKMREEILNTKYVKERDELRGKQLSTVTSMEQLKGEYNATRERIQQRLGVSLENYTVRQDGVLIEVDGEGNPINYAGPEG